MKYTDDTPGTDGGIEQKIYLPAAAGTSTEPGPVGRLLTALFRRRGTFLGTGRPKNR